MAYLAKFDPTLNDWRTTNTMNTKHTPGPWKVGYFNDVRTGDGHRSLANVSSSFELPAEANARLIAAAPELLEALKLALGDLEQAQAETHIDFLGSIDAARAAITKATGNTNL